MSFVHFVWGVVTGGVAAFVGFVFSSFLVGLWGRFRDRGRGGKLKVRKVSGPDSFFEFNQRRDVPEVKAEEVKEK